MKIKRINTRHGTAHIRELPIRACIYRLCRALEGVLDGSSLSF